MKSDGTHETSMPRASRGLRMLNVCVCLKLANVNGGCRRTVELRLNRLQRPAALVAGELLERVDLGFQFGDEAQKAGGRRVRASAKHRHEPAIVP